LFQKTLKVMKTLKNHMILFDAECPMCRVYTHAFVKTGMLDHNGRSSYQEETHAGMTGNGQLMKLL